MAEIGGLLEPQLPSLRRYALALTREASRAEDIVQTCIVRALANQERWAEGTNLQGWLCTILHNVFVGQLRRDARERAWRAATDLESAAIPGSDPELWCRVVELQAALGKLSECQREIVLRIGLDGDTYDRVAETLGIPLGTVRSRLSRGRQQLRNLADAGPVTRRAKPPATSRRSGAIDTKHPAQSPNGAAHAEPPGAVASARSAHSRRCGSDDRIAAGPELRWINVAVRTRGEDGCWVNSTRVLATMTETAMADVPVEVKKAPSAEPAAVPEVWRSFRSEMDRLFDRFAGDFGFPSLRRMLDVEPWRRISPFRFSAPAIDMSEDDKAYRISAELPGLDAKDVDVSTSGNMLVLKGEKHQEKEEKQKNYHLSERAYGSFQRSFELAASIDRDKISADFSKGVLTITLPKTPEAQKHQKKIEVRSG